MKKHPSKPMVLVSPIWVCGFDDVGNVEWEMAAMEINGKDLKVMVFEWIGHAIQAGCVFAKANGVNCVWVGDGKKLTHKVDARKWLRQTAKQAKEAKKE